MNDGTTSTDGRREIWSGPPQDLIISVALFEHDNSVLSAMKTLVDAAIIGGIAAAGTAVFGPVGTPTAGGLAYLLVPKLTAFAFENVLGLSDDLIDTETLAPYHNDQVGPMPPIQRLGGMSYTHATELLTDGNASYKVYFRLIREEIHQEL